MSGFDDLSMIGVFDAGVPNLERVVLRANSGVNLASYALIVALKPQLNGANLPLRDHFFWLGNTILDSGDWIFVYTAPGTAQLTPIHTTTESLLSLYWGKTQTIFQDRNLTPGLVKIEGAAFPLEAPQLPRPT
ncbi:MULTISPECIES: hypothetical protein [unclassified Stenotrophomonas maltophilia group]|uniref:hypothetical protein n=1 Tax=unclassified Stenotrophomonas maltophilia group TaxID=2961925 RepID=UPI00131F14EE|nr:MULTISPECIES: hypothetical protein [unclassified Stenotrophomonas maltophilia group]